MSQQDYTRSKEDLNKTLHDIVEAQKALKANGGDATHKLSEKVTEIKTAMRTLQEAQIAINRDANRADQAESVLEDYIETGEDELKSASAVVLTKEQASRGVEARGYVNFGEFNGALRLRSVKHSDGSYSPGLLDDAPQTPWQEKLQILVDRRSFIRGCQHRPHTPSLDRQVLRHLARAPGLLRKIFADSAGVGAEWIPDNESSVLQRELQMARRVEALFETFGILPGGNMLNPFLSLGLRPYLAGAATGDDPAQYTSSTMTTAQRTVTAKKLAVRMQVDRDASEDSLVAFESLGRAQLVEALIDAFEDVIINGDTTATHQDTGIAGWDIRGRWGSAGLGSSKDHRRMDIGLRARATDVSNTTDGGSAQTFAGFQSGRATMDAPHGLNNVAAITSPEYMLAKMLLFAEVVTLDKYGSGFTALTGELGRLGGVPIIMSDFVDKEYNASGIYDDSTKTKTGLVLVNRSRFKVGLRRGSRIETQTDITRDLQNYVATERKTFHTFDSSTKKNVAWIYNLSVS